MYIVCLFTHNLSHFLADRQAPSLLVVIHSLGSAFWEYAPPMCGCGGYLRCYSLYLPWLFGFHFVYRENIRTHNTFTDIFTHFLTTGLNLSTVESQKSIEYRNIQKSKISLHDDLCRCSKRKWPIEKCATNVIYAKKHLLESEFRPLFFLLKSRETQQV